MEFKIKVAVIPVCLSTIFFGCAATVPLTGVTRAGDELWTDTAKMVVMRAKIYAKCDHVDTIQSEILRVNPIGTGSTPASIKYSSTDERWIASLCGQKVPVLVTFTPDGQGGTFFSTSIENK